MKHYKKFIILIALSLSNKIMSITTVDTSIVKELEKVCQSPKDSKEAESCLAKIEKIESEPTVELKTKEVAGKDIVDKTINFLKALPDQFKLQDKKVDFARQQITKGLANLNIIRSGNTQAIKKLQGDNHDQKTYLNNIASLTWGLFAKAVDKGQGFTGGTIIFSDPNHNIYNFLLEYAKRENSDIKVGKIDLKSSSANCLAYARKSSHFPELTKTEAQFGIDIREGQKGSLMESLPTNKQHLLFGRYSSGYTFIKMEHFGLCSSDSSVRKHAFSWFKKRVLGHDSGISRKEDFKFNKTISSLLKEFSNNKLVKNSCKNQLNFIRDYYVCANTLKQSSNKDAVSLANMFIKDLSQHLDNLAVRRGNEVILNEQEISA